MLLVVAIGKSHNLKLVSSYHVISRVYALLLVKYISLEVQKVLQ